MLEKFRPKAFPRFHLRSRLDEYSSRKERRFPDEGGEYEDRAERAALDIFPLSALKEMHSNILFKITLVFSVILVVFLLSVMNFSFSEAIIHKIHYVTTWQTDFVALGRQAVPVLKSMWEGNPERGLEREVIAPSSGEENEENDAHQFYLPIEGQVIKKYGYGFNPVLQSEEMTYGLVFSASGKRDVAASIPGRVSQIKDDPHYGQLVVLRHSGGIETFYGLLSEIYVTEGEEVGRGASIARAGLDAESLHSLLYFEARKNDRPFDPLPFFADQPNT